MLWQKQKISSKLFWESRENLFKLKKWFFLEICLSRQKEIWKQNPRKVTFIPLKNTCWKSTNLLFPFNQLFALDLEGLFLVILLTKDLLLFLTNLDRRDTKAHWSATTRITLRYSMVWSRKGKYLTLTLYRLTKFTREF